MLETSPINAKSVLNSLTTKLTWDATCAYTQERSPSLAMFVGKASSERTEWSNTPTLTRRRRRWAEAWCDNKQTRADTCTGPGATITCDDTTWQPASGPREASLVPDPLSWISVTRAWWKTHFLWSIPWQDTAYVPRVRKCRSLHHYVYSKVISPWCHMQTNELPEQYETMNLNNLYRKWFCRSFVKI